MSKLDTSRTMILKYDGEVVMDLDRKCRILTVAELDDLLEKINSAKSFIKKMDWSEQDIEDWNEETKRKSLEEDKEFVPKRKEKKEESFLYLIQNTVTKNLKIGLSKNPKSRLRQLNIASDQKLVLLSFVEGNSSIESTAHHIFRDLRLNTEWFTFDHSIIEFFNSVSNPVEA